MRTAVRLVAAVCLTATSVGSLAKAQDISRGDQAPPSITVEGEASRNVAPDLALLSIGVTTTTRNAAQQAARENGKIGEALIATARGTGIAQADIATTNVTLSPVYDEPKNGNPPRVRAFQAANVITVTMGNPNAAGDLAERLLDQGANELQGIAFMVIDPERVLDALRAEAAKNGQHRAQIYAEAVGVKLGRVLLIRPDSGGVPEPRAFKLAVPINDSTIAVPLAAGLQKLEARVSVTWALAKISRTAEIASQTCAA